MSVPKASNIVNKRMKNNYFEIVFKVTWVILLLNTLYMWGWWTFLKYAFKDILENDFWILNLIIPNILTIGILLIYTKELLVGYKPKSKVKNKKSLFLFLSLVSILIIVQFPQFALILDKPELINIEIILTLIITFMAYFGIVGNRVMKLNQNI